MHELNATSDEELARQVIAGGGGTLPEAELCRRFGRRVRLYGRSRLHDDDAADELVQRVLLLVLRKLRGGEVREPQRIASFVLGTARMVALEMRRPREQPMELDEELPCPRADLVPDVLELARLGECLKALPERDRSVVALSFFEDQSAADVGGALNMRPDHVRVARHRAVARLRRCMDLGGEEAA